MISRTSGGHGVRSPNPLPGPAAVPSSPELAAAPCLHTTGTSMLRPSLPFCSTCTPLACRHSARRSTENNPSFLRLYAIESLRRNREEGSGACAFETAKQQYDALRVTNPELPPLPIGLREDSLRSAADIEEAAAFYNTGHLSSIPLPSYPPRQLGCLPDGLHPLLSPGLHSLLSPGLHTLMPPSSYQLPSSAASINLRAGAGIPGGHLEEPERWTDEAAERWTEPAGLLGGSSAGITLTDSFDLLACPVTDMGGVPSLPLGAADMAELLGRMLEETYKAKLQEKGACPPGLLPEPTPACAAWRQAACAISAFKQPRREAAWSPTGSAISASGSGSSALWQPQQQAVSVGVSTPLGTPGLPWPAASEALPWSASEGSHWSASEELPGSTSAPLWLLGAASSPMWLPCNDSPAGAGGRPASAALVPQLAAPETGRPAADCEVSISVGRFAAPYHPKMFRSHISDNGSSYTAHAEPVFPEHGGGCQTHGTDNSGAGTPHLNTGHEVHVVENTEVFLQEVECVMHGEPEHTYECFDPFNEEVGAVSKKIDNRGSVWHVTPLHSLVSLCSR